MSGVKPVSGEYGPPPAPGAPEPEVARFHALVNSDDFGGFQRNTHAKQLASDFHKLSPERINATLSSAKPEDIREFGLMLSHDGVGGQTGLSTGERRELFHDLASKAGGSQLATLSRGLVYDSLDRYGGDVKRLAAAVAGLHDDHESANNDRLQQTKLDFIRALGTDETFSPRPSPNGVMVGGAGVGLSTVLSNLHGKAADQGFHILYPDRINSLVLSVVGRDYDDSLYHATHRCDTASLIKAAASGTDPNLKAAIFMAVERARGGDPALGDDQTKAIVAAQTALLQSDPTGVVRALNNAQPSGKALKSYTRAIIQSSMSDSPTLKQVQLSPLGQIIEKLQHGNNPKSDAFDYIAQQPNKKGQVQAFPKRSRFGLFLRRHDSWHQKHHQGSYGSSNHYEVHCVRDDICGHDLHRDHPDCDGGGTSRGWRRGSDSHRSCRGRDGCCCPNRNDSDAARYNGVWDTGRSLSDRFFDKLSHRRQDCTIDQW